jgi:CHAT domain
MQAIRGLAAECETLGELEALFRAEASEDLLRQERGRVRLDQLVQLGRGIAFDPKSPAPDKDAARSDIRSGLVMGICMGISGLYSASCDPELIDNRLAKPQLDAARSLVLEDLESIFDFKMMHESAKVLALFLLERAKAEMRFDDFRMALRASQIVADGQSEDHLAWGEVALVTLEHLMTTDVFNEREIPERLAILRQLHGLLGPIAEKGQISSATLSELVEKAGEANSSSFSLTTDFGPYLETVNRLDAAYQVTGNSAYLDDLILYCEPARPGESDVEAANRLNDVALFLRRRALCLGNTTDLLTAKEKQLQALRLTDEGDPSWRLYNTNVAASEYALMNVYSRSVAQGLDRLRPYLPTLPFETDEDDLDDAAQACALSLAVELTAAFQHDEETAKAPLLRRAIVAAEEAHRLFEADGNTEDATDMRLLVEGLRGLVAALGGDGHDEAGTAALVELLERTARHTRFATSILGIVRWMLEEVPDSRDALIEALRSRYAVQPMGVTSMQVFDCEILRWLTSGVLWRGDIASGDQADRAGVSHLVKEFMYQAASCGAGDIARAASDTPLATAAAVSREAAVQFALAGEVDEAAYLAQASVAVRANTALLNRVRREGVDDDRLSPAQGESCASLMAIVGWTTTAVLLRLPGGEWELAAQHPSEDLTRYEHLDWMGEEHNPEGLLSLKRWLDELEPSLCEALAASIARAQASTSTPVLFLQTGCLSRYPLALVAAHRPEIELPLPAVPGLLADEAALMLRRPLSSNRCAFLAGAPTVPGAGTIDVDADLEAIEASGLDTTVLGRDGHGQGNAAWPPPESAQILHYAGHLVPSGADATEIALANETRIPVYEIRGTDLRSLQVAVLMCCYSSSSHLTFSAEQIQHLAGAFLEAGTSAVVASLWPAFDLPAQLFTERFYRELGSGSDVAVCFAAAVDAIRTHRVDGMAPFAHPVYWAGFTLFAGVGSWLPDPSPGSPSAAMAPAG